MLSPSELQQLLPVAITAAERASKIILEVYNSGDFQTERKDDHSPLTIADKRSHESIVKDLAKSSSIPILSEEGKDIPYAQRKHWSVFWLVDPLDGTKEFLKRNGEFTVNIALVEGQTPVLGVIVVPVTGEVFYAARGSGAFLKRADQTLTLPQRERADLKEPGLRVVASRSHMSPETEEFISTLKKPQLVTAGSSLKFMMMANGDADLYPRFAPTMEWDTAAGQAIVNEVGLQVLDKIGGNPLLYNKESLRNGWFVVV